MNTSEYNHQYYLAHQNEIYQRARRWAKDNPEKIAIKNKRYQKTQKYKQYRKLRDVNRRARENNAIGHLTNQEWEYLKKVYNYTCPKCWLKETQIKLTVDHKVPLSKGGTHNLDNIQPLCGKCNSSKKDKIWFASCPLKIAA